MKHASAILVSHNMSQVRSFCDSGIVLEDGKLQYFEDLDEAIAVHQEMMA